MSVVAASTISPGVRWLAAGAGLAFVLLIWTLAALPRGGVWRWNVVEGADGASSTSKFQWALWTAVVLASYLALWILRAVAGHPARLPNLPASLLTAMGLSSVTMAAAKGITTIQTAGNTPTIVKAPSKLAGILRDDEGYPELAKMQLVAWTLIAVGVFLTEVIHMISHAQFNKPLPDIDPTLVVLTGLGQAAYLGKKLIVATTPILSGIVPGRGSISSLVTASGSNFGAPQAGSQITIDGEAVAAQVNSWSDTSIAFSIPETDAKGQTLSGKTIQVGVVVGGQGSANTWPFDATGAVLTNLSITTGSVGTLVTMTGVGFGSRRAGDEIMINGKVSPGLARTWTPTQVTFKVPLADPDGNGLQAGTVVEVGLYAQQTSSENTLLFTVS
jgi:hypothetical protein